MRDSCPLQRLRHRRIAGALGEIDLDARPFADNQLDRTQGNKSPVAFKGCAVSKIAVKPERDDLNVIGCGPCGGDSVNAFGLCGCCQQHVRDALLASVQPSDDRG